MLASNPIQQSNDIKTLHDAGLQNNSVFQVKDVSLAEPPFTSKYISTTRMNSVILQSAQLIQGLLPTSHESLLSLKNYIYIFQGNRRRTKTGFHVTMNAKSPCKKLFNGYFANDIL